MHDLFGKLSYREWDTLCSMIEKGLAETTIAYLNGKITSDERMFLDDVLLSVHGDLMMIWGDDAWLIRALDQ